MRKQYSKKDIKEFLEKYPIASRFMDKKSDVIEEDNLLRINGTTYLLNLGEWIPHLKILLKYSDLLPKVTVDMGAVKFVVKGADIMRPGITHLEVFTKNDFVVIVDETHGKALSVCKAMYDSEEIKNFKEGKVLKNYHYVGDEYW